MVTYFTIAGDEVQWNSDDHDSRRRIIDNSVREIGSFNFTWFLCVYQGAYMHRSQVFDLSDCT